VQIIEKYRDQEEKILYIIMTSWALTFCLKCRAFKKMTIGQHIEPVLSYRCTELYWTVGATTPFKKICIIVCIQVPPHTSTYQFYLNNQSSSCRSMRILIELSLLETEPSYRNKPPLISNFNQHDKFKCGVGESWGEFGSRRKS